jgi:hypothetical protein
VQCHTHSLCLTVVLLAESRPGNPILRNCVSICGITRALPWHDTRINLNASVSTAGEHGSKSIGCACLHTRKGFVHVTLERFLVQMLA